MAERAAIVKRENRILWYEIGAGNCEVERLERNEAGSSRRMARVCLWTMDESGQDRFERSRLYTFTDDQDDEVIPDSLGP